mmetsp:Transcript_19175/g.32109  ORF Transcript_19175/g.32109 Transcript_19175/m.32109 type:complete len:242 (+) Transcript_19175:2130-2855(+)
MCINSYFLLTERLGGSSPPPSSLSLSLLSLSLSHIRDLLERTNVVTLREPVLERTLLPGDADIRPSILEMFEAISSAPLDPSPKKTLLARAANIALFLRVRRRSDTINRADDSKVSHDIGWASDDRRFRPFVRISSYGTLPALSRSSTLKRLLMRRIKSGVAPPIRIAAIMMNSLLSNFPSPSSMPNSCINLISSSVTGAIIRWKIKLSSEASMIKLMSKPKEILMRGTPMLVYSAVTTSW